MPINIFIRVDLPDPLGPKIAIFCPLVISKFAFLNMILSSKEKSRSLNKIFSK